MIPTLQTEIRDINFGFGEGDAMKVCINFSSEKFFKTSKFCKHSVLFTLIVFVQASCMEVEGTLESFAKSYFMHTPGISTVCDSKNSGHIFEIEAALCLPRILKGQQVVGFSLFFDFFGTNERFRLKNGFFTPKAVDYDIVSTDYVIECKNSLSESSLHLEQFQKEKQMLMFFKLLNTKIRNGKVKILGFFNKKGRLLFKLSLKKKDLIFSCSWAERENINSGLEKVLIAIMILSNKNLKIFSKNPVPEKVKSIITSHGFDLYDSINLFYGGMQTQPPV